MKAITISLMLLAFPFYLFGQHHCNQISSIVEVPNNPDSWEGFTLQHEPAIAKDGQLYFMAYHNSNQLSIWRSDGTTTGTIKLEQETFPYGFQWMENEITRDGVFIMDVDSTWNILRVGESSMTELPELKKFKYRHIQAVNDSTYYLAGSANNKMYAIKYNIFSREITELGEIFDDSGSFKMHLSSSAAFFQGEPFLERIYFEETKELITIIDYLDGLNITATKTLNSHFYDKYLNVTYKDVDDNWNDILINIESQQVTPSFGHGRFTEHIEIGDYIYFIGRKVISKYNKIDGSTYLLYDNKQPQSSSIIHDNKIYFVGFKIGGLDPILSLDLTTEELETLENTSEVSLSSQWTNFIIVDDKLFYFTEKDEKRYLSYYDLNLKEEIQVELLTEDLGRTSTHMLAYINDRLITSKIFDGGDHELLLCESPSSTKSSTFSQVAKVFPNPVIHHLNIETKISVFESTVSIWNTQSKLVLNSKFNPNQKIDVAAFTPGYYYGLIKNKDEVIKFNFIKQ